MSARKIHDASVGPSLTIPVWCDRTALWKGTRPDRKPLASTDPSHVPCRRCRRTLGDSPARRAAGRTRPRPPPHTATLSRPRPHTHGDVTRGAVVMGSGLVHVFMVSARLEPV